MTKRKREAESNEQKQIHNEKVRLTTKTKREAKSNEQKQIHNEKKNCDEDKMGCRVR